MQLILLIYEELLTIGEKKTNNFIERMGCPEKKNVNSGYRYKNMFNLMYTKMQIKIILGY